MIKIKRTNGFKEIKFGSIADGGYKPYKILTPNGFQYIKAFQWIKRGPTKKIETKFGEIFCDPKHRVLTTNGEKFVVDLDKTDKLVGYKNEEVEFKISDGPISDLYDIEIDNPHWYYTSGIVSHNSIALVNTGAAAILKGQNVLHVTLEMSKEKTGLRYAGCFTDRWIRRRFDGQVRDFMLSRLKSIKTTVDKHLVIVEYPPNDISVDVIHANINTLRRVHGINIDIVVVDYLELLNPRETVRDDRDYGIQKRVAVELCRLAKKENVLVFSAFQTNRDGNENLNSNSNEKVIELSKVAESYAKTFAVDYLVTINQNKQEYDSGKESAADDAAITNAQCRFYVAKNRNGPKFKLITAKINYETMKMRESEDQTI